MATKMMQFRVTGMACGSCLNRVKSILEPYAETVTITLTPAVATLVNPTADIEQLNKALSAAGDYELIQSD